MVYTGSSTSKRNPFTNLITNEYGESRLHIACRNGQIPSVKSFISKGHPTEIKDTCGWLPIHEAANVGSYEIVKILVEDGNCNVNAKSGENSDPDLAELGCVTGMMYAVVQCTCHVRDLPCGHLKIIKYLLEKNSSVNFAYGNGQSFLSVYLEKYGRWKTKFNSEMIEFIKQRSLGTKLQDVTVKFDFDSEEDENQSSKHPPSQFRKSPKSKQPVEILEVYQKPGISTVEIVPDDDEIFEKHAKKRDKLKAKKKLAFERSKSSNKQSLE